MLGVWNNNEYFSALVFGVTNKLCIFVTENIYTCKSCIIAI